jgi:acetyl esterase/lipase
LFLADTSVRLPEIREDLLDGYKWVLHELPKIHPALEPERNFVFGGSAGGTSAMLVVRTDSAA